MKNSLGYIYSLYNVKNPSRIYIGSTNDIEKRFIRHVNSYKSYLNKKQPFVTVYDLIDGEDDLKNLVIENLKCIIVQNKSALLHSERHFINIMREKSYDIVNKNTPIASKTELMQKNIIKYHTVYKHIKMDCVNCGKCIQYHNRNNHVCLKTI